MTWRHNLMRTTVVLVVIAAAVVSAAGAWAYSSSRDTPSAVEGYCAILPDAIGLYTGNPITQMGYEIGTVVSITPSATEVRVDFELTEGRSLPADVQAVLRSTSILADRSLELVGNYESGPELEPGTCVPLERSATPKSISEVIGSAATLVDGITPSNTNGIADAVSGLDELVRDRGGDINTLLSTTSTLVENPDQAVADIGSIITDLAELTTALDANSGPLKEIVTALPLTTGNVADALRGSGDLIGALPEMTILVDDLERYMGTETQQVLDALPVAIHLAASRADDIAGFLEPIPGLMGLVAGTTAGGDGLSVSYRGNQQATNLDLLQQVFAGGVR